MPKPTLIEYERSKDLGNFQIERVKVVCEVLPGETACKVLDICKRFVAASMAEGMDDVELNRAKTIMADELENTGRDVQWAKKVLASREGLAENLHVL